MRIKLGKPQIFALLITLFGLVLRLWGITWGLPNEDRIFTYHPDEGVNLIGGVLDEGVARPHLDLKFYHYGGLYFYAWQGAVAVNRAYGLVKQSQPEHMLQQSPDNPGAMILVGRLLTATLGGGTIWFLFLLGTKLYSENAGVIAAAMYAILPAAVVHAHYATVDVPATFVVVLALLIGSRILKFSGWKSALIAGIICGLAGATKYNVIVVALAPIGAVLLRKSDNRKQLFAQLGLITVGCGLGFVIGCAGLLLNPEGFLHDLTFELKKSGEGMGLLFADTPNGLYYHIVSSMRYGIGIPMLLLVLVSVGWTIRTRSKSDIYLLLFLVPYYLVIGFSQVKFLRYIIPMLPVLSLFVGRFLAEPWPQISMLRAVRVCGGEVATITLFITFAMVNTFSTTDSRDEARDWMDKNIKVGSTVAFIGIPWYFSPPLSPLFFAPSPATRRTAGEGLHFQLIIPNGEWTPETLAANPQYFAVSEFETGDAIRIGLPAAKPFFEHWKSDYIAHEFEKTPTFMGISLGKPEYVPNDWLYTFPRTTIYERKK